MAISWHRKIEEIVEVIDNIGTEWECSFIRDMSEKAKQRSNWEPTAKQADVIESLYEKACNSPF